MKRTLMTIAVIALLAGMLMGCEQLLAALLGDTPATPTEQVEGFLAAASADPRDPLAMKAYFDPETAQYGSMQLEAYWDNTYFALGQGPFSLVNGQEGPEDAEFPGSVTVSGNVTNTVLPETGYPAVFVLTSVDDTLDPLIRKITVTVTDPPEVIEKVLQ